MRHRTLELDVLRFVAALMVVVFHYGFVAGHRSMLVFPDLAGIARYGYLGVDLFFLISGFVIMASAEGRTALSFAACRARRLYPAFWACCSLTALAATVLAGNRPGAWQYLANLTMFPHTFRAKPIDGVYWSLLVEARFYLMVFVVIATGQLRAIRLWLAAWLALAALDQAVDLRGVSDLLVLRYAPWFVAGAAFQFLSGSGRRRADFALAAAGVAVALGWAWRGAGEFGLQYGTTLDRAAVMGLEGAFFGLFALIAAGRLGLLRHRRLAALGAVTYPLYLVHQQIGYMVMRAVPAAVEPHALLAGLIAAMILVAAIIHRLVEVPSARLLRRTPSLRPLIRAAGPSVSSESQA